MATGGCQCGAVRFDVAGEPVHRALCHCSDCRRSSGAPMVGWAAYAEADVHVTAGDPKVYASSPGVERRFCGTCGTGLFYRNPAVLPGLLDVQICTLDDPEAAAPQVHIQTAERVGWTQTLDALPSFARYPG